MYTVTATFYYTPQFKDITPDIPAFVTEILALTNQAYANSGISMTLSLHCLQEAEGLNDVVDRKQMLQQFGDYKPSLRELLQSADIAVLLVGSMNRCGRATMLGLTEQPEPRTTLVVRKDCALPYFSLAHEVAHLAGAAHHGESQNS